MATIAELRECITEAKKRPCECVTCGDCQGSGMIPYRTGFSHEDDYESCDCYGGVSGICSRCSDLEDFEADLTECENRLAKGV